MEAKKIYDDSFCEGLTPDPELLVSDWSDEYRVLSQIASAEPGRWRTSRTPYLREIMDCLSPSSSVEKVVFMKGSQIGASEMGGNWIGYIIDRSPGPMLVVQPTVEMGKRWSKGRLAPLIEDTPILQGKVKDPRSRDSGNTVQSKEFPGGVITITGSNSAVGLRSMPVRYLFLDEVDAYPGDAGGEGDPVALSIQRTATFSRRKIFMASTPTISGISRIEREFAAASKNYYYVPCPKCKEYQKLQWKQISWQNDNPKTARYVCEHCDAEIENHSKTWMLENGKWINEDTDNINSKIAGFHLSGLYSPVGWYSWEQAVTSFLAAKDNDNLLKVWYNTVLGEVWVDKGEAPEWEHLYERRESYKIGTIPQNGLLLTAGADVHKDRIEVEIVAWGKNKESWSIAYNVIIGDPATRDIWQKLENIINAPYRHESGIDLSVAMLAIDSGYATQEVYNWTRNQPSSKVMAVKGMDKATVAVGSPRKVDVTISGKKLNRGARFWPVGVSLLKSELYHFLKLKAVDEDKFPDGYCHFPKYESEYFKQLTSEQLVTKIVKSYPKREWQKTRARNEALDCRIYARAAGLALGMDHWHESKWNALVEVVNDRLENKVKVKRMRRRVRFSGIMS